MSVKVTLSVDSQDLHNDIEHPLNHLDFSDDRGDTYDDPTDKTTFDTYLNSNETVTWECVERSNGTKLSITNISIDSAPDGFFTSAPAAQSDGTWQATVENNATAANLVCEYTITFNDGITGDADVPIDPKLQIRKN